MPSQQLPIYLEPIPLARWWERDTTSTPPEGVVPKVGHERCGSHTKFMLSCRQYDRLLARAQGNCEVCGLPDSDNAHGRLYIDHNNDLGWWAVRGLLCRPCNAALHPGATGTPRFKKYIGRSFYITLLRDAQVVDMHPVEPSAGAIVLDRGGRPWRREVGGWWPRHRRYPQLPRTWRWLIYTFGPHNLNEYQTAT